MNFVLALQMFFIFYMALLFRNQEIKDSPRVIPLLINSSIKLNCSSPKNSSTKHVWWFNGRIIFANIFTPTEIGIFNVRGTFVNSTFSYLHITEFSQNNTGNYTCRDGNSVNEFYAVTERDSDEIIEHSDTQTDQTEHKDSGLIQYILSNPAFTTTLCFGVAFGLLCCVITIIGLAKKLRGSIKHRSRYVHETILSTTVEEEKSIPTETDSSSEYDKPGIAFFSFKCISLHNMLPSCRAVLRFEGRLRNCDLKVKKVLVSGLADTENGLNQKMWKNYVNAVIQLQGHDNLLETIGLCKEGAGELFVIQYYYDTTLKLHLSSLFHNPEDCTNLVQRSFIQFASDIIKGMEFLYSNECFHPGLATEKILVNESYVCKLYEFCSHQDVKTFNEVNFPKCESMLIITLAPEYLTSGEYTSASDIWSLGITLWEIFCAGENFPEKVDIKFLENFRSGTVNLPKPKHCPPLLFDTLELCWSPRSSDRPTISELRIKLCELHSQLEYTDIRSQIDRGIYTPHVYQMLEPQHG